MFRCPQHESHKEGEAAVAVKGKKGCLRVVGILMVVVHDVVEHLFGVHGG